MPLSKARDRERKRKTTAKIRLEKATFVPQGIKEFQPSGEALQKMIDNIQPSVQSGDVNPSDEQEAHWIDGDGNEVWDDD